MDYRPTILAPLFFLAVFSPVLLQAQDTRTQVKEAIHISLGDHLQGVFPTNDCQANDSGHNYSGEFNITRSQEVQGTLRVWGQAKVTYRNRRTGGSTAVEYYAECKKSMDRWW